VSDEDSKDTDSNIIRSSRGLINGYLDSIDNTLEYKSEYEECQFR